MNRSKTQRLAAMAAACLACAACRKKEAPRPAAVAATDAGARRGADRLLPGELAEGRVRVFGLALPRDVKVKRYFNDSAFARGPIAPEPIANYIRARVEGAKVEVGVARTVFNDAHVKGQPPDKRVRIEVSAEEHETVVIVRDVTPPPVPHGLSEDELWRRTGISKDGKILDPSQMQ
jgi:hypothetical protein